VTVDPVHSSSPVIERPAPEKKQAAPASRSNDSGNQGSAAIARPKSIPAPLAIPEHEVKVILDTTDNNTLVYQVLDKGSGDVVLQVPPADQLRGIHESQELLQRIAARGKASTSGELSAPATRVEGNDNGNKL
jgi:hypothetical protein